MQEIGAQAHKHGSICLDFTYLRLTVMEARPLICCIQSLRVRSKQRVDLHVILLQALCFSKPMQDNLQPCADDLLMGAGMLALWEGLRTHSGVLWFDGLPESPFAI